jgi:riboflavin kinase
MSESAATPAVGNDELAALRQVGLDGGLTGPVKISCAGLAAELDTSGQTASRRLQRLDEAGYLDREVVSDGQWVSVTEAGESALRSEYAAYRTLFESPGVVTLEGSVTGGMGEGKHYISLPGYMEQFRERLGYEPFPGTLNVDLTADSVRVRPGIRSLDAVPIDEWEDDERTFGSATCYAATLEGAGETYAGAHIIVPDRTHHDETQIEVIAPDRLRDALGLDDGDRITITVEGVEDDGADAGTVEGAGAAEGI